MDVPKAAGAQKQRKKKRPRPSAEPPAAGPRQPRPREAPPSVFATGALDTVAALHPFPYPHKVLPGLFDRATLLAVREELGSLQRSFKETDLFRVFQTGDLANMDPSDPVHAAQLPHTLRLRSALYSPAFRAWVSQLTGCDELTEQQDCSCNVYGRGGHLLCHDDVIGTRAVSYILYLSWPDEDWSPSLGGALELYELETPSPQNTSSPQNKTQSQAEGALQPPQPRASPSLLLPPSFGSLALFPVAPGRSFHAVAEVLSASEPRVSISGWFHAPTPPAGAEASASLSQLQAVAGAAQEGFGPLPEPQKPRPTPREKEGQPAQGGEREASTGAHGDTAPAPHAASSTRTADLTPAAASAPVAPAHTAPAHATTASTSRPALVPAVPRSLSAAASSPLLSYLGGLISPSYLRVDTLKAVRAQLRSQGAVQLSGFLKPDIAAGLLGAAAAADLDAGLGEGAPPQYGAGIGGGWRVVGPPHLQRYLRYAPQQSGSVGAAGDRLAVGDKGGRGHAAAGAVGPAGAGTASAAGAAGWSGAAAGVGEEGSPGDAARVTGELLTGVSAILSSPAFLWLLERICGGRPTHSRTQIRRFRPGMDYTLAHAAQMISAKELRRHPRLDATFVVAPSARPGARPARRAAVAWDSGDVGGFECLVPADDDKHAAEVYRADDALPGVTSVHAVSNSLVLAIRPARMMRFVKYVSAAAPGSRWDVSVEYQLAEGGGREGRGAEGSGAKTSARRGEDREGESGGREGNQGEESDGGPSRGGKRGGSAEGSAGIPKRAKPSSGRRHKQAKSGG